MKLGATLGLLGGGQLGRMAAVAARELGFRVVALDPDPNCSAKPVVDHLITAGFDDVAAAEDLARRADVITIEIEKIDPRCLRAVAALKPLRPSVDSIEMIQDRGAQRTWLAKSGAPQGPHRLIKSVEELDKAREELDASSYFLKAARGGYDGRGQFEIEKKTSSKEAFDALGGRPAVLEAALDLEHELSVMVARSPQGEVRTFPVALNHHEHRILKWSVLPAPLDVELLRRGREIAEKIAGALKLEGILAIELFHTRSGEVFVNELAPRPHNTFHTTVFGSATSQFEQLVRAVLDLPLGSTEPVRPTALVNLLGDLWDGDEPPPLVGALSHDAVKLHFYGKEKARPGRKMGHLLASAGTADEAVERALAGARELGVR